VAEMKYIHEAVESIVPYLRTGNLIILESTVPPLTCRNTMTPILERSGLKVGKDLFLAHCPERILPGDVFHRSSTTNGYRSGRPGSRFGEGNILVFVKEIPPRPSI
jgi:UDP-N-acetyl-D-mannosaminuronic acid dehydrogenase